MVTYYIKKYGVHELHKANCVWLPIRKGIEKLGNFESDEQALQKAKTLFKEVSPCFSCCKISKKQHLSQVKT